MPTDLTPGTLHIGDVAAAADVNVQTVRYYERRGLVRPEGRSDGGYRLYAPEAVGTVQFVKRAQALGFSLDEVSELLDLRRDGARSRRDVRTIAAAKVAEIDARLRDLGAMRESLSRLVAECPCDDSTPREECEILDVLDGVRPEPGTTSPPSSPERHTGARHVASHSSRR
jgi:Cu(I)-responsive transcriptional regulator